MLLLLVGMFLIGRRGRAAAPAGSMLLKAGATVSQLEQGLNASAALQAAPAIPAPALMDPALATRARALELAQKNPVRAAHMLRAWIASDSDNPGAKHG